eukprot:11889582-Heterocapsa_arctica.AAC.1
MCPEKWLPKVTTGIELTAKGWEKYGPKLTPSSQWASRHHAPYGGYFSVLEDEDEDEQENSDGEIFI